MILLTFWGVCTSSISRSVSRRCLTIIEPSTSRVENGSKRGFSDCSYGFTRRVEYSFNVQKGLVRLAMSIGLGRWIVVIQRTFDWKSSGIRQFSRQNRGNSHQNWRPPSSVWHYGAGFLPSSTVLPVYLLRASSNSPYFHCPVFPHHSQRVTCFKGERSSCVREKKGNTE